MVSGLAAGHVIFIPRVSPLFSWSCLSAGLCVCQYVRAVLFMNLAYCILLVCLDETLSSKGTGLLCLSPCLPEVSDSERQPQYFEGRQEGHCKRPHCVRQAQCKHVCNHCQGYHGGQYVSVRVLWRILFLA